MQVCHVPPHVYQMGFTLEQEGDRYIARNSDAEVIGMFASQDEAIAYLEDSAEAEAAELDRFDPMDDPNCDWLMDIIDPARLLG